MMTADYGSSIRASRMHVARTRGAASGVALLVLGLWAAIVPFIGPYFDFAFTPSPGDAWYWTAGRGWLEVAPGAAAFVGGLLLLGSSSRAITSFGAWLAAAGGAWLIVGPVLADLLNLDLGTPDPAATSTVQTLENLFFFFAIGALILFVAAVALGRMSVHSVRDVRAAERRGVADGSPAATTTRRDHDHPTPHPDHDAVDASGRHEVPAANTSGYPAEDTVVQEPTERRAR